MQRLIRRLVLSCTKFESYDEIVFQPPLKAFSYFFLIIFLFSLLIFPNHFHRNEKVILPALEQLSKDFPRMEIRNGTLVTDFDKPFVRRNSFVSVVIDPNGVFKKNDFPATWILFTRQSLQINYQTKAGTVLSYQNPFIFSLFHELADFDASGGVLTGQVFLKFKDVFQKTFFLNGVFFGIQAFAISLFFNFIFSIFGYAYSKMIYTSLTWKNIRNISYYAYTPVLVFLVFCFYLGLDIVSLQPIYFLLYLLFINGVIKRYKLPEEEFFE